MAGNRAIYRAEHIGAYQYRLRFRNTNPRDNKQWFVFDSRTKSIRAWADRSKAISGQVNQRYNNGNAANVRPWKNEIYQRTAWYGGSRRNIRNLAGMCLDVHGNSNSNGRHLIWYTCHNGANQAWYIDQRTSALMQTSEAGGIKNIIYNTLNETNEDADGAKSSPQ